MSPNSAIMCFLLFVVIYADQKDFTGIVFKSAACAHGIFKFTGNFPVGNKGFLGLGIISEIAQMDKEGQNIVF